MAHTKKDIAESYTLLERLEKTDVLLDAVLDGKQLQIGWAGIGKSTLGSVDVPPSAHKVIWNLVTKWRDDAREQLEGLGVEWRDATPH
jgi:hypothetical protein